MKDTTSEVKHVYQDMLQSASGEKRMRMASQSFEAARQMVLASLTPGLSPAETQIQLFLRFYQNDFTLEQQSLIIQHIKDKHPNSD